MKNIFFSLIAAFVCNVSFCQKAKLIDVKGTEIAVILNIDENNSFQEYYLFQYKDNVFSDLASENNISVIQINGGMIKLNCNGKAVTFTIDNNYKNENEKVYFGYGLSKRLGNFSLTEDYINPTSITNIVMVNNKLNTRTITCHSGGEGATECSVTPSDINVGTASCSVNCGAGYHACCDDSKGECKCIANKPVVKSLQPN